MAFLATLKTNYVRLKLVPCFPRRLASGLVLGRCSHIEVLFSEVAVPSERNGAVARLCFCLSREVFGMSVVHDLSSTLAMLLVPADTSPRSCEDTAHLLPYILGLARTE